MKMLTLYPYLKGTTWVFDDPRTGLKEEAFVLGSSEVLTRLVNAKNIPAAEIGFSLQFSDEPFEGAHATLRWLRSDNIQLLPGQDGSASQMMGNWYSGVIDGEEMPGWLCPALLKYFLLAPHRIYVGVAPLPAGVDPIWNINPDDLHPRRFVSAPSPE